MGAGTSFLALATSWSSEVASPLLFGLCAYEPSVQSDGEAISTLKYLFGGGMY